MSDKNITKLTEMAKRGTKFRDEHEFELYGETVVAILRPLVDDEYLPIAAAIAQHLDIETDNIEEGEGVKEIMEEVDEEVEEARDEEGQIEIEKLDKEFVGLMQQAAILGLAGQKDEDGETEEFGRDQAEETVESLMGGYSVELGNEVLEVSGSVRDAERFRGSRGRVESTRSE